MYGMGMVVHPPKLHCNFGWCVTVARRVWLVTVAPLLPLRSFLRKTAIRGRFTNDTAGRASSVSKIACTVADCGIVEVHPCTPLRGALG